MIPKYFEVGPEKPGGNVSKMILGVVVVSESFDLGCNSIPAILIPRALYFWFTALSTTTDWDTGRCTSMLFTCYKKRPRVPRYLLEGLLASDGPVLLY